MNTYTPSSDRIVHNTSVDFQKRSVSKPIHIVQYDHGLPILAITMYMGGVAYTLPATANANIRLKKPDGKTVYNPVLGCSADRNIIYVEVTYQMTTLHGEIAPVLEVVVADNVAGTSPIFIEIDKNPIQQGDIESTDEMKTLVAYVEAAKVSEEKAKTSETNAKVSETNAKTSETKAATSEANAKTSETNAAASATKAKTSETNAKTSETKAATSETKAKTSEDNAKDSEEKANASKESASESATQAKTSEEKAKTSETNAKVSETNAKTSETKAATSEANAKTSETNAAASATKAKTSETNAKTSETNAKSSETKAKTSEDNAKDSEEKAKESEGLALAYAQRAEASDVGELMSQLGKHEITLDLKDSNDESILDSSNNGVQTTVRFIDMEDVKGLAQQVCDLQNLLYEIIQNGIGSGDNGRLNDLVEQMEAVNEKIAEFNTKITSMETDVNKLKSNALLDSNY